MRRGPCHAGGPLAAPPPSPQLSGASLAHAVTVPALLAPGWARPIDRAAPLTPPPLPAPPALQDAPTLAAGLQAFGAAFLQAWTDLLLSTYLSLATAVAFYFVCLGFARGGGVGAAPTEREAPQPVWQQGARRGGGAGGAPKRRRGAVVGPIAKLKTGGLSTQVIFSVMGVGSACAQSRWSSWMTTSLR
jgi:hypothetical protein